jgi:ferredoxin
MATVITSECINCGACEPECPNVAIYQGGVEWEMDGARHPAISDDIFYIVPEKCTECVGFYDHEACAAVCPVDCCVPDPDRPETEAVLIERAKQLHPETEFAADFPSRFRKTEEPAAAPVVGETGAPAAAASATPPAAPAASSPVTTVAPGGRVERALPRQRIAVPPPPPVTPRPKQFSGELEDDFENVLGAVMFGGAGRGHRLLRFLVKAAQPLLGAASDAGKRRLERVIGDRVVFDATGATVRNALLNMLLYPALGVAFAVGLRHQSFFSARMDLWIFLGMTLGACEWMVRMRETVFGGADSSAVPLRGALYAPVANVLLGLVTAATRGQSQESRVGFDGFYGRRFDDKTERERRYGEVYRIEDLSGGYVVRLEFPSRLPATSLIDDLGLAGDMPDYDYDISLSNGHLVVRGMVIDPRARKLTAVAAAFPPAFTTRVALGRPVLGFRHRYRDKVLEIALPARR